MRVSPEAASDAHRQSHAVAGFPVRRKVSWGVRGPSPGLDLVQSALILGTFFCKAKTLSSLFIRLRPKTPLSVLISYGRPLHWNGVTLVTSL